MIAESKLPPNRVLTYHKIAPGIDFGLGCVSPQQFQAQLSALQTSGYKLVTLSQLRSEYRADPMAVAITFDDGYENIWQYAHPLLASAGVPATVFIITDYIGKLNSWDISPGFRFRHLNHQQIRDLIGSGWEIASHGLDHCSLRGLAETEINRQLLRSRQQLERQFGVAVHYFAASFGHADTRLIGLCRNNGYRGLCQLFPWRYYRHPHPFIIPRLAVYATDTPASVRRKISHGRGFRLELLCQNLINFCANATVLVKVLR